MPGRVWYRDPSSSVYIVQKRDGKVNTMDVYARGYLCGIDMLD